MTTRVTVRNEGPHKDVIVDTMGKSTVAPHEPHRLSSATAIQVGDSQEFFVFDSQYLIVRERD